MKIILGSSNKLTSLAIRIYNSSKWSHCGVVVNNKVIEATASHGVVETPIEDFKGRYVKYKIIEIPHEGDYQKRLYSQIGKPYDWGAIWKFVFRGDWGDSEKWFCYELAAYASGILNSDYTDRITSNHLLMLSRKS